MVNPIEIAMRDMSRLIDLANVNADTIPEVINANGPTYGAKGDGSDSTAALQKAIDAAQNAGRSEVYLAPGNYVYTTLTNTSGIVFVGDGVTVSGSPVIPVISPAQLNAQLADIAYPVRARGPSETNDNAAMVEALSKSDYVFVPKGRTIEIGEVEVTGKKVFGEGIVKKLSGSVNAFHIKGDGSVVSGLTFQGETSVSQPHCDVKIGEGAANVRITDCVFLTKTYSAIAAAEEGSPYDEPVSGVIIENNVFRKQDSEGTGYSRPLFLHSVDNAIITNNIFRDSSRDAVRLRQNDGFIIITNNQFLNIGDPNGTGGETADAIDCYYSGCELTVSNNIVNVTQSVGFSFKGWSADGSYGSRRVIVSQNQIYDAYISGIQVSGDDNYDGEGSYKYFVGAVISGNIIKGCNRANINGDGSMYNAAILLQKLCRNIVITDNYVFANHSHGIYCYNSVSGKDFNKEIIIENNICMNNGISTSPGRGLGVEASADCIIRGNISKNDVNLENPYQGHGIYHSAISSSGGYFPPKSNIITDNICRDNLTNQISTTPNNSRADNIAIFERNLQSGTTSSDYRGSWHQARGQFFGGVPAVGDGAFTDGDVFRNVSPTADKNISHRIKIETGFLAYGTGWGTTAQRPSLNANDAGYSYFDTTIQKMILWDGTQWLE